MDNLIKKIIKEELENSNDGSLDSEDNIDLPLDTDPTKGFVAPSKKVISDVCEKEKFCKRQGPITFGQLRLLVESAQRKNLSYDVGEGFYKAVIRLFPWFFPQIAVAGFIGSSIRAFNKIIRPGLEDTRGYKNWWGKTMMRIMDTVEGDIPHEDPISKIFFISDGLLHMLDRKFKLKFTRYIAELAASKPDDEPVPEYFVENELRNWINQKFLLNPPLQPKTINESEEDDWGWVEDTREHANYNGHPQGIVKIYDHDEIDRICDVIDNYNGFPAKTDRSNLHGGLEYRRDELDGMSAEDDFDYGEAMLSVTFFVEKEPKGYGPNLLSVGYWPYEVDERDIEDWLAQDDTYNREYEKYDSIEQVENLFKDYQKPE